MREFAPLPDEAYGGYNGESRYCSPLIAMNIEAEKPTMAASAIAEVVLSGSTLYSWRVSSNLQANKLIAKTTDNQPPYQLVPNRQYDHPAPQEIRIFFRSSRCLLLNSRPLGHYPSLAGNVRIARDSGDGPRTYIWHRPAGNAKSTGGPTLNARRTRDAQKMGKVSGLAANSNAIGFPIVVIETLRHCQHLCDRIRAACGYQTIPPACERNQGNHIGPEQALPSEWSYERRRQCDKNRRE